MTAIAQTTWVYPDSFFPYPADRPFEVRNIQIGFIAFCATAREAFQRMKDDGGSDTYAIDRRVAGFKESLVAVGWAAQGGRTAEELKSRYPNLTVA